MNGTPSAPHLRIGTRGSDLALWQAHHVRDLIEARGGTCDIQVLSTQGDREQVQAFEKLEGKGFFTKEIEQALLDGEVDLAVHSHKDLETQQPAGLSIIAVPERAAVEDLLLIRRESTAAQPWLPLKPGADVGTSSVRRRDQLLLLRPDLAISPLRGNVPTRVQRLREGKHDAIVLAAAGVERLELDLSDLIVHRLPPRLFVPAPAQGALALQMRADDPLTEWMSACTHAPTAAAVAEERDVLRELNGGCQLPFGAHRPSEGPLRCFLQGKNGPQRIVARDAHHALSLLRHGLSQVSLLITRVPKPGDLLHRLAEGSGIRLLEHPLSYPVPLQTPHAPDVPFDWVWLTSPGAVRMAEEWLDDHPQANIALPGPGTAEALPERFHDRMLHVGSGHPFQAWREFASSVMAGARVAMPHSAHSLKRWEETETNAILCPWVQYELRLTHEPPPACDAVCFTSPSQVQAWTGNQPEQILALGRSTSDALHAKGWSHEMAETPDAIGIWEALQRV